MKTSKVRDGLYAITGTDLLIERSDDGARQWGAGKQWMLCPAGYPDRVLLVGGSKRDVLERLVEILEACPR